MPTIKSDASYRVVEREDFVARFLIGADDPDTTEDADAHIHLPDGSTRYATFLTLAAIQRILSGEQAMTIYKAIKPEAEQAAELAVALAKGETPPEATDKVNNGMKDVPSFILNPVPVTVDNINDTVVKDGFWSVDEICTGKYASACKKAGIQ